MTSREDPPPNADMAELVGLDRGQRLRCAACGNLTRFDVETDERVRRFWHVDLAGRGTAEEEERVEVVVRAITCRWCGAREAVEAVAAPGAEGGPAR